MWHTSWLVDEMCKYEMYLISIVEDTEQTRFGLQTDGWTDGQTDGQSETGIPTINFVGEGNNDWPFSDDFIQQKNSPEFVISEKLWLSD